MFRLRGVSPAIRKTVATFLKNGADLDCIAFEIHIECEIFNDTSFQQVENKSRSSLENTMAATKMIHVRVDDDIRDEASEVLGSLGLTVSDAVRIFLHRVVASQSFPLELKVPNEATRAALLEAREIRKARKARFATPDELFKDLNGN